MTNSTQTPILTERFTRAVDYARPLQPPKTRKGTKIPYMAHLLGVAIAGDGRGWRRGSHHRRHGDRCHSSRHGRGPRRPADSRRRKVRNSAPMSQRMVERPLRHARRGSRQKRRLGAAQESLSCSPRHIAGRRARHLRRRQALQRKVHPRRSEGIRPCRLGPVQARTEGPALVFSFAARMIFEPRLNSCMVGELKRVVDEISYLVASEWPGEQGTTSPEKS